MTTGAILFVDETDLGLLDGMCIVADHALGTAIFNRLSMSRFAIILADADMAATAKVWNTDVVRCADEAAVRTHRHGKVCRVTTMAAMTGDAIRSMDALAPFLDRSSQASTLPGMTLNTDSLFLCQGTVNSGQHQQRENDDGNEQSDHE
jgi:hypothetical protein